MSTDLALKHDWTPDQVKLITDTVARNASPDELKLFLYRCKNMQLDPLKPGQVHFIKYGNNPGSTVIGIEGFRSIAGRTGKLSGIKRGVIKDANGNLVAGWAEVYRTDWAHCAREEAPLCEYSTGQNMWAKKPETMIKKVAECAALRMAFPDDLGGIYEEAEMDQEPDSPPAALRPAAPAPIGKAPVVIKPPTIKELESQIRALAAEINCPWPDALKWAEEVMGKPPGQATVADMQKFVEVLQTKSAGMERLYERHRTQNL